MCSSLKNNSISFIKRKLQRNMMEEAIMSQDQPLSFDERESLKKILETIEIEDFNKLYDISKKNISIRILMIYSGRLNQEQKDSELVWASESGHLEIVQYLILTGADKHKLDDLALMQASIHRHLEVVKFLIENK
jgi:hypothetical protein